MSQRESLIDQLKVWSSKFFRSELTPRELDEIISQLTILLKQAKKISPTEEEEVPWFAQFPNDF